MANIGNSTLTPAAPGAPGAPGRRTLLGAITALSCVPVLGVSAVPDPDAGLIRLCNAFQDCHARSCAAPDDTDEWELWLDRRTQFSHAIERMTPTTDTGRLAKAKVALVLFEEASPDASQGDYERMALAALRHLVQGAEA